MKILSAHVKDLIVFEAISDCGIFQALLVRVKGKSYIDRASHNSIKAIINCIKYTLIP